MLDAGDVVVLAAGVRHERDVVIDDVRSTALHANASAGFVLDRAGRPLGEVADELAASHGLDASRARDDVFGFAFQLNRMLLANVVSSRRGWRGALAWLVACLHLVPAAGLPFRPWRRVPLDTCSAPRAAATTVYALRARSLTVACLAALLGLQVAALAAPGTAFAWLAVGAGAGVGLALHEAGHAVALRGVPAALVLAGSRTFVVHSAVSGARRRLIAAAGPAAAAGPGACAAVIARPVGSMTVALGACALCGHAIGLTVATRDGRAACDA